MREALADERSESIKATTHLPVFFPSTELCAFPCTYYLLMVPRHCAMDLNDYVGRLI